VKNSLHLETAAAELASWIIAVPIGVRRSFLGAMSMMVFAAFITDGSLMLRETV
jgi:hypothetical protein